MQRQGLAVGEVEAPRGWRISIYASVALWVATLAGNAALFAVHPTRHWPVLETVEALQVASLIPVAVILHRLNRGSSASLPLTMVGVFAMFVGVVIDIGFVTERLTFGKGQVGIVGIIDAVCLLAWLLAGNVVAWRNATLPRGLALVGMASAATVMLLYPVWAIGLLRVRRLHRVGHTN